MSELIDNVSRSRKELLKHLILQLHGGTAVEAVRKQLVRLLGQVPYDLVVEVEGELIAEGLPAEEVAKLCHVHGEALQGVVQPGLTQLGGASRTPPGHPVDTFRRENGALRGVLAELTRAWTSLEAVPDGDDPSDVLLSLRERLNDLADVDKHYLRKEHLLFPFLEKRGITAPPKVMWTKHDETRALLRATEEALDAWPATAAEARAALDLTLRPAAQAVSDMIDREEQILLPMALDTLTEAEWIEIARQSDEIGYCLAEPGEGWPPPEAQASTPAAGAGEPAGRIRFPTGSFSLPELQAFLDALPLDATFVDADDRVRYFTHGRERVFSRSKAVLGRLVHHCHPPASVGVVQEILQGFRSGKHDRAAFWIQLRGRFVHIEYVALRDGAGKYLGCLETTQDLTEKRALTGEQRLLSWKDEP